MEHTVKDNLNPEIKALLATCSLENANKLFRKKEYLYAMEMYLELADEEPYALTNLGFMYSQGYGVEPDVHKAMEYHLRAAEKGNDSAMISIGNLYMSSPEIGIDYAKAYEWYKKAGTSPIAEHEALSKMYEYGVGVEKNPDKAKEHADLAEEERMLELFFDLTR